MGTTRRHRDSRRSRRLEVVQELARRDYLMDFRPGAGIRLAPHFYTSDEELDLVIGEIKKVAEEVKVTT